VRRRTGTRGEGVGRGIFRRTRNGKKRRQQTEEVEGGGGVPASREKGGHPSTMGLMPRQMALEVLGFRV